MVRRGRVARGGGRNELNPDLGSLPDQATDRGSPVRKGFGLRAANTTFYFASVALFDDTLLSDDLIPLPGKQHPDRCQ